MGASARQARSNSGRGRRTFLRYGIVAAVLTMLPLLPTGAYAYQLFGGRWSNSDIGNLTYYNFSGYSENPTAATSWNNAGTKAKFYTSSPFSAFIFLKKENAGNNGVDGQAVLTPSPTANPYTSGETYLNSYYVDGYSSQKRQSVAAHEQGHLLGLAHESGCVLMNEATSSRYDSCGVYTPQQDDINGVNAIYGAP